MADENPSDWTAEDERAFTYLLLRDTKVHGVIFMDEAGVIRGWNRGAEFITGFSASEVIGQPFSLIFGSEDRERGLDEQELRMAREMGIAEDERWHVRKDGGRVWTAGATQPLCDPAGNFIGFAKIFTDATHLRSRVKYLENVLQECSTQQAERDYFLGSIAHELRNPLAPLKTALQIIQMQAPERAAFAQPLRIMERQMGFLERIVEDLVDLTRVSQGKLSIRYGRVVLQQLVAEAHEACRGAATGKGIVMQPLLPSVPLEVDIDGERMLQVVVNLLNNAIKYTPPGGSIWASVTADQTHFLILVRDTGQGIGADLLPKVFDAFTQAGDAGSARGSGVGIGLAVVKEIVSLHAGTVEVRSEGEGKGSEFIVRIPLRRPQGQSREPLPRDASA